MNVRMNLLAGLVLGGAMMVGCEERPEARPAPDRTTTPTAPSDYDRDTTTTQSSARAQTLIMEVRQHINAGRFDEAETSLVELESMKSSLPQTTQSEIDQLRQQLRQKQDTTTTPPTSTTPPSSPTTPPDR